MDVERCKENAVRVLAAAPLALLAAALTCPATDIEPPWVEDAAAGDVGVDGRPEGSPEEVAEDPGDPDVPPTLVPAECDPDELAAAGLCLRVGSRSAALRWHFDTPAAARLRCRGGEAAELQIESAEPLRAHRALAAPLAPGSYLRCDLLWLRHGSETPLLAFGFATPADDLPWVAITEVSANPSGPEPAQEFVEIANLGTEPARLDGWRLEDEGGGAYLPEGTLLPPGGILLLVPDPFDADLAPRPPAATPLARLGRALGSSGLRNSGEAVFLVAPDDRIVSSYPNGLGAAADGVSAERIPARAPEVDPTAWVWSGPAGPTPGLVSGL